MRVVWWLYRNPHLSVADTALVQVLRKWDRLPASAREQATLISPSRVREASFEAAKSPHSSERIALALVAQDFVSHELAPIVVALLEDPNSRVITCAERSLISLANAFAIEYGGESAARLTLAERTDLCNQVAISISKAPQDSKAPFTAAFALLDPSTLRCKSELTAWFAKSMGSDPNPLQACLRNRANQLSRLRAWQWLFLRTFSQASLDRLVHTTAISDHLPILDRGHLAIRPARSARLQTLANSPETIFPLPAMLPHLSESALCGLTIIVKSFRPSESYLQHLSTHALAACSTLARRRLISIASSAHLLDSAFDSNETLARGAMIRWSAVGVGKMHTSNSRHAAKLTRSPHACVRELAKQELERLTGGDINSTQSRMYSWRSLAEDRAVVTSSLRTALESGTTDEQMRALNFIRRHALVPEFSDVLMSMAQSSFDGEATTKDPRILATIISLLRRTPTAIPTLLVAADNEEPRVRANAIESLLRTAHAATPSITGKAMERCEDSSPRVKANSIRGLLVASQSILEAKPVRVYEPHAVSALLGMLHDDRALHRLSGVWAAERVLCGSGQAHLGQAWSEVSKALSTVARDDTEGHVRRRAVAAARRLSAELKSEFSTPDFGVHA